jgi:hypothetical protein
MQNRGRNVDWPGKQLRTSDGITLEMIESNLYDTHVYSREGHDYQGQLFFVAGRIAITAWHVCEEMVASRDGGYTELLQGKNGKRINMKIMNKDLRCAQIKGTEAGLVLFPRFVKTHAKRLDHFFKDTDTYGNQTATIVECNLVTRLVNSEMLSRTVPYMSLQVSDPYHEGKHDIYWLYTNTDEHDAGTLDGDSGGIWFTSNTKMQRRIMGPHSGPSKTYVWASCVTQEDIVYTAQDKGWERELNVDIEHQELNLETVGGVPFADALEAVGATKQGNSLPQRNPIEPSTIARRLWDVGMRPNQLPTQMKAFNPRRLNQLFYERNWTDKMWTEDEGPVSPLELGQFKMNMPAKAIPLDLIDEVAKGWAIQLDKPPVIRILHPKDVVYGNYGLNKDHIDHTTSVGWPLSKVEGCKTRKAIFGEKFEDWNPTFLALLKKIFDTNSSDRFYLPVYTDSLKIERDDCESVLRGKTRIFFGGELAFLVYGTCIGGDILDFFKRRCTGPICPGLNAHSRQWGELWTRLCKHPNFIATDAKNWDLSQQAQMVWGLTRLWYYWSRGIPLDNLAEDFLKDDDWDTHLEKAIRGCSESLHIILGHVYRMWKSWMSGNWATSWGNCGLNGLCWRICFVVLARENKVTFSQPYMQAYAKYVEDCFYGDDCVLSVSDYIKGWFNQRSCARVFKELFGITLTDATKNDIDRDFTPRSEVTFIGRRFVSRDGHIWAPIKKSIIEDALFWAADKGNKPSISADNVRSALLEAVHHGREYYDYLYEVLARACTGLVKFEPLSFECVANEIRQR